MISLHTLTQCAEVAELADALDSKSSVVTLRAGSSPAFGTIEFTGLPSVLLESLFLLRFYFDSFYIFPYNPRHSAVTKKIRPKILKRGIRSSRIIEISKRST